MPGFLAAVGASLLTGVGATTLAATTGIAIAVGLTAVVGAGYSTYRSLRAAKLRDAGDGGAATSSQQVLVRSTVESRKIVYGEALVSGPLVFMNTNGDSPTPNGALYAVVALTGHQSSSFEGFYLDDKFIPVADVDTAGDGSVDANTGSHGYGPVSSLPIVYLRGHLGTAAQTVDTMLDSGFTMWTSDHRGRGITYLVARMDQMEGAQEIWQDGAPSNIAAVLRGKLVYDPRLDSTFSGTWGTGSGAHRSNDSTTWDWSENPALCVADYLRDSDLGVGVDYTNIDYNDVAIAADACDEAVDIPTASTQARFTCNGVLSCGDGHSENIEKLLSSMAGTLRLYGGRYHITAGVWPASSSFALDESHLIGPLSFTPQPERTERFNAVRGIYFDPGRNYKESQYLAVEDTALQTARDTGQVLWKDLDLPMTNNEYMAQRLAMRAVEQGSQTGVLVFQTGYNGLDIAPGDRGTVSLDELGWSSKNFRCIGLRHVDMVGVELVLKEDDSDAYDDPLEGDYGTRSGATVVSLPRVRRFLGESQLFDDFVYLSVSELEMRWTRRRGGIADGDISLVTGLTDAPGGQAVRFGNNSGSDEWWGALTDVLIPYDPLSTYEVGAIVRRNSGSGVFYCGFECVANNRTTMINTSGANAYTDAHYVAAAGAAPGSGWTTYRGYLRGLGSSPAVVASNDPSDPSEAYTGTTYIRPMMLVNYNAQAGQMDVAALWVRRSPTVGTPNIGEDAASEVSSAAVAGPVTINQTAGTGAESDWIASVNFTPPIDTTVTVRVFGNADTTGSDTVGFYAARIARTDSPFTVYSNAISIDSGIGYSVVADEVTASLLAGVTYQCGLYATVNDNGVTNQSADYSNAHIVVRAYKR